MIKFGEKSVKSGYLDNQEIDKIYLGDIKVFDKVLELLPDGYTAVEYIKSTGSGTISTGIVPSASATKVSIDIEIEVAPSNTVRYIWYSYYHSSSSTSYYNFNLVWGTKGIGYVISSSISATPMYFSTATQNSRTKIVIDCYNKQGSIDGKTFTLGSLGSLSSSMSALRLLGNGTAGYNVSAKLYSAQISNRGVIVRNFIPCKSPTNTVGMYDTVTQKFFTGSFTAGPPI